jgi:pyrimidine operon attenuation protein/uracil phosphoribosyltransferase
VGDRATPRFQGPPLIRLGASAYSFSIDTREVLFSAFGLPSDFGFLYSDFLPSPLMSESTFILNAPAIRRALTRIAHEIAERNEAGSEVVVVGIQRGGVPLAQRLGALLAGIWGQPVPTGSLDVSMHRDDLDRRVAPNVQPTVIPFDVTGKTVVLVDDVLFNGRTVRAAMDALNDFGRPRCIQLAVLIDRGHRELPIKADFVGKNLPTSHTESVRVRLTELGGVDEVVIEK